ncbi:ribonuclease III [Oscillospiraceae bacterium Marseille-Q3528]|nr:ribonuclease III [Oscillospiraceae bacterium Marseille-Q3528]
MDESIIYLKEKFSLPQVDIQTYSPLTLAYIGDAAYELVVRTFLVDQGNSRPDKLHRKASSMVKAAAQAAMAEALKDSLTEEELSVYRRGRNAKSPTMAKNASMSDYRKATGFEALMGYLYLKGEQKRLIDLVYAGFVSQGFIAEEKI